MRRREAISVLCAGAAGLLVGRRALAAGARRFRIVMVLWRGETEAEAGFRRELLALGVDADIKVRDLARDLTRLPDVVAEIRQSRPDLVYAWGTGVTLGLVGRWDGVDPAAHLTDVPVVFTMVSSPRGAGIEPPEGEPPRANVTGVSHIAPLPAQINAIRAFLPMERLGIVYNPAEANSLANLAELRALAPIARFQLLEAPVPTGADGQPDATAVPDLVADLSRRQADILYIGPDSFVGANRDALTAAGIAAGVPAFTATELEIRESQAMIGLVSRYATVGQLAAGKAEKILVGDTPPSAVPIETLKRFSYLIRLPVALRLGRYPSLQLIDYAEVIR